MSIQHINLIFILLFFKISLYFVIIKLFMIENRAHGRSNCKDQIQLFNSGYLSKVKTIFFFIVKNYWHKIIIVNCSKFCSLCCIHASKASYDFILSACHDLLTCRLCAFFGVFSVLNARDYSVD